MPKPGKQYRAKKDLLTANKRYKVDEALKLIGQMTFAKFDETVDIALRLGVDPKHADQQVRGAVNMPHGIGKKVRVAVFAKGEKAQEAETAGADFVGADDLVEKIKGGWMDFDAAVATPDMMVAVSKVGKQLGPRGLMPNPKTGTVTFDLSKAIKEVKAGKVEFRVDKAGIVHAPIGKVSFGAEKLKANFMTLMENVQRAKPTGAKGKYLKTLSISTTMSPAVRVDLGEFETTV